MRYLLSWLLFLIGDLLSKPMNTFECCDWLYHPYNKLMIWSSDIQGKGAGPWKDVDDE